MQHDRRGDGDRRFVETPDSLRDCHLLHQKGLTVAALSDCSRGRIRGFVSPGDGEDSFEITPLSDEQKDLVEALQLR